MDRDERDSRPLPGPNRQPQVYQFTPEELRVMKECNVESFYQRCLPFGSLLGVSAYYGVKMGYLRPNPRYGATPKVVAAVVIGYFLGKFSYHTKCAEKLMQLPNSHVGEVLRQRRKGIYRESLEPGFGPGMSLAPFSNVNPSDTYSDLQSDSSVDIDTTRPQMNELDDLHRPSVDNPVYEEEMPPVQKHETTYEELRRKNREAYQQKRIGSYREPPKSPPPPPPSDSPLQRDAPTEPPLIKNKYGDTWG